METPGALYFWGNIGKSVATKSNSRVNKGVTSMEEDRWEQGETTDYKASL